MKQVEQTKFGGPDAPREEQGDCFAACLASILELSLAEVPSFTPRQGSEYLTPSGKHWWDEALDWLAEHNLTILPLKAGVMQEEGFIPVKDSVGFYRGSYQLLTTHGPRGYDHTVVASAGRVVWDPHPQREMGIGEPDEWWLLVPIDPSKCSATKED